MFSVYKFNLVNHRHVLLNSCWQLPLLQQLMMKQVNISIHDCPEAGLDANGSYLFCFEIVDGIAGCDAMRLKQHDSGNDE